jgi:RNA polymerase sigma-70 factor (ECF subfamily)
VRGFDFFYRSEYRSVVALAAILSGSRWAAEDLAQEAFSAAFREWDRVRDFAHPHIWVRRVVANKSASLIRRNVAEVKARTRLDGSRPPLQQLPDESEDLWDAVRRLPRRQTEAIVLVYLDGRSLEEAGEVMGCTAGTVKTHLKRGRGSLARKLEPERRPVHDH